VEPGRNAPGIVQQGPDRQALGPDHGRDDDDDTSFRAATALLDRVQRAQEAADVEARLAALEARLAEVERQLGGEFK
jgi:hypothetical protein